MSPPKKRPFPESQESWAAVKKFGLIADAKTLSLRLTP
jgi:hypothetical protein